MALHEHVESLRSKHARLDAKIADELHRPLPDQSALAQLKREKLRLKEEIQRAAPADRDRAGAALN